MVKLHVNFEDAAPYDFQRSDKKIKNPKAKLKVNKSKGVINIDEATVLMNVPPDVWEYKLGTRTAIEWVLDQYKEKSPTDATVRNKFFNYKFSDHKERVIDLLGKVCTVSLQTQIITKSMIDTPR